MARCGIAEFRTVCKKRGFLGSGHCFFLGFNLILIVISNAKGGIESTHRQERPGKVGPILAKLVAQGIALEVNTRGSYDWQKRVGPEDWVLRRYRELGGELLTIGSDAHSTRFVGAGYEQAAELLRQTGFSAYTIYRDRTPIQIAI